MIEKTILFLDIEETIIKSLDEPDLIIDNMHKIKDFIHKEKPDEINIFSFGLWTNEDRDRFNKNIKNFIEEKLEIKFKNIPTLSEINKVTFKQNNISKIEIDDIEIITLMGKFKTFIEFCFNNFTNTKCILIDDTVPNTTITNRDTSLIIRTINI